MKIKKLAVFGAACLFAATPALAADWSELDAPAVTAPEVFDSTPQAASTMAEEIHATGTQSDKPADGSEKQSDSQS